MRSESFQRRNRHPGRAFLLLTQPTILAVTVVIICLQWRVPTVVHLDFTASWNDAIADVADVQARIISGAFFPVETHQLTVRYPENPEIPPRRNSQPGVLFLRSGDTLVIEDAAADFQQQEVQISLIGEVALLSLRQEKQEYDYRLTMFDRLVHSSYALGAGLALWLLLTAIAWVKLYQELQ